MARSDASTTYPAERVKAFTDAVVAIAMTLLILPLMESVAEAAAHDVTVSEWFGEHQTQVTALGLSFAIIAMFWTMHHRLFARVEQVTNRLIWLLVAWMLTIVWLPIATALLSLPTDATQTTVYIGSMLATAVVGTLIRWYLQRSPGLHAIPDGVLRGGFAADIALVILHVAALVLAVTVPQIGYFALFLLILVSPLQRLVLRLLRPKHSSQAT